MAKILVVDDEPEMLDILDLILVKEGYDVDIVESGSECLKKARKEKYDLIILDIRMPEMSGWETLQKLKDIGIAKKVKIVMLTVEKGPGVEIFGLQDVVDDYLIKPFDQKVIVKHIKEVLS